MPIDFEKYAAKGNEFMNQLAKKLGDESDRIHAARILRSTFRVLRKHLTQEESMQLLAQLPMALKSVYVEGWKINQAHSRIKTIEDFAAEVIQEEGNAAWRDFSNVEEAIQDVRAVIETLTSYVSREEMEEAFGTLPKEIKEVFITWIPS
jgi:uncharacterized protein (DUF2267 family)